ncbi:hypothetical protein EX30DRAFT_312486 [Ascodesmis nigricans]|uniref:CENP-V/GFA domain-containing protein n=1 Tax=Ascodesmis nigricans TaxID=341454 RepID=A0A4S2MPG4_9PEZI|nr:hypothetical protein EX30DRAFT_312486 [Ascodesmis nigricans]
MTRPPYLSDIPGFRKVYDASCFCGSVQYEIGAERPLDAKFCHCVTCQKLHGAPFQWSAIFAKPSIRFTSGAANLTYWTPHLRTQEYDLPCKVSCATCRAPLMDEGRNMVLVFPTLVRFGGEEERRRFYPSCHIFYERRCMDVPDGLPKYAGHKAESELVPERGGGGGGEGGEGGA